MTSDLLSTVSSSALAAASPSLSGRSRVRKTYTVHENPPRQIRPVGRDAWMLDRLLAAGTTGCTSLENPAPRTSHYVFKLRTRFGLNIETITEEHDGPYRGTHARYVLQTRVTPVEGAI
jgi:hypothetical protein